MIKGAKKKKRAEMADVAKAARKLIKEIDDRSSAPPNKGRSAKAKKDSGKPMGLLDASAKVLSDSTGPLKCKEMVSQAISSKYWTPKTGKTPDATLYSAILREINRKGEASRFRKVGPGSFEKPRNN